MNTKIAKKIHQINKVKQETQTRESGMLSPKLPPFPTNQH